MNSSLDLLAHELEEKNELISLLTQQLEQAAEQLDRMQRAGDAGRGGESRQKSSLTPAVTEGMQHFLSEWGELKPGMALGRIELMLAQLQQTLDQKVIQPQVEIAVQPSNKSSKAVVEAPVENDFWSRMKSQLMEEKTEGDREVELVEEQAEEVREQVVESKSESKVKYVSEEPFDFRVKRIDEGPDMPAEVDVTSATISEIQHAMEARDEYISYLHDRLNKAEGHEHFKLPNDWSIFNKYPGEMRVKLEFLEAQLLSVLRTTEIQQSMERARSARLENKLKFERELLARHASRLGVSLNDEAREEPERKKGMREQENFSKKTKTNKGWKLWGNGGE